MEAWKWWSIWWLLSGSGWFQVQGIWKESWDHKLRGLTEERIQLLFKDRKHLFKVSGKSECIDWRDSYQSVSSVTQLCPTLCDPMNRSTPGLPVHHQLPEFTQTHVHRVSDAIQPSHPLSSLPPPAPNPSQHQSLLQWVKSSHEVAKVLEFQL